MVQTESQPVPPHPRGCFKTEQVEFQTTLSLRWGPTAEWQREGSLNFPPPLIPVPLSLLSLQSYGVWVVLGLGRLC